MRTVPVGRVEGRFSRDFADIVVDLPPFRLFLGDEFGPLVVDDDLSARHLPNGDGCHPPGSATFAHSIEIALRGPVRMGVHDEAIRVGLETRIEYVNRIIDAADADGIRGRIDTDCVEHVEQVRSRATKAVQGQRQRLARNPDAPWVARVGVLEKPCRAVRAGIASEGVAAARASLGDQHLDSAEFDQYFPPFHRGGLLGFGKDGVEFVRDLSLDRHVQTVEISIDHFHYAILPFCRSRGGCYKNPPFENPAVRISPSGAGLTAREVVGK